MGTFENTKFEIQIRADGPWVKVTYDIWRSWSGGRRIDGLPYHGPVRIFGEGLPDTGWNTVDANNLAEQELTDGDN